MTKKQEPELKLPVSTAEVMAAIKDGVREAFGEALDQIDLYRAVINGVAGAFDKLWAEDIIAAIREGIKDGLSQ